MTSDLIQFAGLVALAIVAITQWRQTHGCGYVDGEAVAEWRGMP